MEVSYKRKLLDGDFSMRLLMNHPMDDETAAAGAAPIPNANPEWRGSLQLQYARDKWSLFAQERYIGDSLKQNRRNRRHRYER